MAIEIGTKVKATCIDNAEYIGTLLEICLGIDRENPTMASIIIEEEANEDMQYGQVHIWCNGLKNIETLK